MTNHIGVTTPVTPTLAVPAWPNRPPGHRCNGATVPRDWGQVDTGCRHHRTQPAGVGDNPRPTAGEDTEL